MGVRGLETFLKENRQSLCRSEVLDSAGAGSRARVPVVVDAWGVVYQLYLDALPWASGGEYLQLYALVRQLVGAWRRVGLEPVFVFDGASPPAKHATALARMQSSVETARLFYSLSEGTRSARGFNRGGNALLPPFASHAFAAALASVGVDTRSAPMGEADGLCVALADEMGGYVLGRDTDLVILCARADGVRGYVPLDMIEWIDAAPTTEPQEAGFSVAAGRRRRRGPVAAGSTSRARSRLIPPASYASPTLVLATYTPAALGQRLRLPPAMLPLLSALVGNDYSPRVDLAAGGRPGERIDRLARVLREQAARPRTAAAAAAEAAGTADPAHTLVSRVLAHLLPPHTSSRELARITDAILDATMGYVLPPPPCCAAAPFCGELDEAGCVAAHSRLSSAGRSPEPAAEPLPEANGEDGTQEQEAEDIKGDDGARSTAAAPVPALRGLSPAVEAYAAARAAGRLGAVTHAWLYPTRIYLHAVLENPSAPSVRAARMPTEARRRAYAVAAEALGGLRWPKRHKRVEAGDSAEQEVANGDGADEAGTTAEASDVEGISAPVNDERVNIKGTAAIPDGAVGQGDDYDSDATSVITSGASSVVTVDDAGEGGAASPGDGADDHDSDADNVAEDLEELEISSTVVEYLRQGSSTRIGSRELDLPEAPCDDGGPLCLQPLEVRLGAYLDALDARTPAIEALPRRLHPLVAAVRMCVVGAAQADTRGMRTWRAGEVRAVVRAAMGCAEAWRRADPNGDVPVRGGDVEASTDASRSDTGAATDPNYPRLTSRHAEMVAAFSASLLDTLALAQSLLLSSTSVVDADLPHATPWIFFSGVALHSLLQGEDPPAQTGWVWDPSMVKAYDRAVAAVMDGLGEYVLDIAASGRDEQGRAGVSPKAHKRPQRRKNDAKPAPPPRKGASRFDVLLED